MVKHAIVIQPTIANRFTNTVIRKGWLFNGFETGRYSERSVPPTGNCWRHPLPHCNLLPQASIVACPGGNYENTF